MLKFSITNCACTWREKYFRYGKETNPLLRCLSIGSFDAAFLADLVACYILDQTKTTWNKLFDYLKIYRDDGLGVARNSTINSI